MNYYFNPKQFHRNSYLDAHLRYLLSQGRYLQGIQHLRVTEHHTKLTGINKPRYRLQHEHIVRIAIYTKASDTLKIKTQRYCLCTT